MTRELSLFLLFFVLLQLSVAEAKYPIGITVDDIPAAGPQLKSQTRMETAKKYLEISRKLQLPKQFGFANGVYIEHMQERKKITEMWAKEHYLGNHTYSHLGLGKQTSKEFIADINKNEPFVSYNSKTKDKYFRYPYLDEGSTEAKRYDIRYFLKQNGYKIAQVSIDSSDWHWNYHYVNCLNQKKNADEIRKAYIDYVVNTAMIKQKQKEMIWGIKRPLKHILLLHLNPLNTDSLEELVKKLKANAFEFIDAKEAIDDPIYLEDSTYMGKDGKDYLEQNIITRKLTQKKEAIVRPLPQNLETMCL